MTEKKEYIPGGDAFRFTGILKNLIENEDSSVISKLYNKLNYVKYGKVENTLLAIRRKIDKWIKLNWDKFSLTEGNGITIDEPDEYCPYHRIYVYDSKDNFLVKLHPEIGMKEAGKNHQYHNHPESITEEDLLSGIKGIVKFLGDNKDLKNEFISMVKESINFKKENKNDKDSK